MADAAELVVRIRGDASDLEATISGVSQQLEELERTQSNTNGVKGVRESTSAYQGLASQLKNTGKGIKEVGESIDTITKPIQYASTALAAGGVASAKFAIDFEDSFAGVKKTVDATPEQLAKIKQGIIDLSTTGIDGRGAIPQTTTELNELAAAGGQLGISQENIIDFTEVMAQMGSATNLVGEEGAATLARFMNVMGTSQGEIRNIGSAIVDLGNHSATTESEIAEMALRMGKYGSSVRMSAADVLGYSAALSSLGIEAQMGGSAIGRTWLSIETAVASGGEGLTKFAKYSGKSAKEFKEQWNTDSSGAFNGLLKGLQSAENLTLALDDLGINNTQDIQAMMALVNGYDLVTESVNRSNTAYQENTALQEEFNAKNETTASKLANTKNNIIEAARSIGETMLPSIQDASTTVANFAKGLSQMSDEQKKVVVNTGATVIALGAITKGSTGLIKWAGNTVEAVGNLKKAFSAGGALAKFAPTLTSIGAAAGPAALAVAGIATAAIVGKVAYDKWYQSQYKWSDGLAEGNEKVKESIEKYKALNEAQTQIKALKMVIESPESSQEQVDNAKSKLEEIKEMLSQEYNLVINSDNSNLEETVETVKNMSKLELTENIYSQMNKLSDLQPKFDSYKTDKSNLEAQASAALKARNEYAELKLTMADLRNEYQNSNDIEKYKQGLQGVAQQLGFTTEVAEQLGMAVDSQTQVANLLQLINGGTDTNGGLNGLKTKSDEYEGLTKKINNLTNAYNEYISISEEMATQSIDLIGMSAKESDSEGVQKNLERVGELVKNADLDMNRYAQSAALAMNGIDNLSTAWEQAANGDGTALNGVINDYIRSMTEFGASSAETAVGVSLLNTECTNMQDAVNRGKIEDVVQKMNETGQTMGLTTEEIVEGTALIKNGFDSVRQAVEKGDINGILKDMMSEGSQQGIDMTADKLTEMSRAMGLIPNEKRIKITADGFEVVDDLTAKVRQLEGKKFVVTVDTEGNTDGVDNVEKKTKQLDGKQCEVIFTADGTPAIATIDNTEYKIAEYDGTTGTAKLIAKNGEAIGVIDLTTGKINLIPTTHDTEITAQDNTSAGVESAKANLDTVKDKTVTLTVQTVQVGGLSNQNVPAAKFGSSGMFVKKAKGTQNFEGGLAMVNDEKGISDPRELIVDKGRAFIPQGKDVLLPLSKGAKVYTASQTKAIMSGMGIPHYATGKDNSDAFTSAKDDWTHYTKTHAVTTAQELEKWLEFQEKFKSNDKDIADIEEQIFSIMQKQTKEFNEQSKAYLEKHSAINDWGDNGDTPLDAFKRIKDRNYQDLQDAKITWDDYVDNVSDAGETLYDDMKSYSDSWLEHQQKYHDMSIDDYIAGIDREAERLEEFYANDVINYQKYVEEKQTLEEKRYDAVAQKNADEYSAWQKDADAWQELRSTYDDWDKYGDSEEDFLKRKIDRVKEFYNAGKISFEEFIDDTNKYSMELYKSQSSAVDELLQKQQDYISNIKDEFSKQEQELRDSWDVQDRKTDMSEVQAQLDVYANSVTDKGQQKYKELQEQMKQLQRDEELYQLQKKNNATIESLEAEYKQMEDGKKNILTGLQNADINISAYVATITDKVSATGGNIESLLSRMLDKFDSFKIENNSMSDNRKIINNFMQMTPEEKQDALNKYVGL